MLFSIIVPVYNTEQFIKQCIDSILSQSFSDFELLLVNDGSTDISGDICDEYAQQDVRVRVLHKANGGVSSARNLGLDNANGEWICFVDSDDILPSHSLDVFFNAINTRHDFLISRYQILDESGKIVREYHKYEDREFSPEELLKELFSDYKEDYQGYIFAKCFRNSLIKHNNLRFNEKIFFNEDRLFVTMFVCQSLKPILYQNQLTYHYWQRPTSAISSLNKGYNRKFVTDFDAHILMKKEIDKLSCASNLRWLTLHSICNSFSCNLDMMSQFGRYDWRIHLHMLWEMMKCGALWFRLKELFHALIFMFFPFFLIKKRQ